MKHKTCDEFNFCVFFIFQVVHNKLMACLNHLVPKSAEAVDIGSTNGASSHRMWYPAKEVSVESLIIGALESAFWVCKACKFDLTYAFFP